MLNEVLIKHLILSKEDQKMITINPIKFNTCKPITFCDKNTADITAGQTILALQNDSAKVNFEKDFQRTYKADAVQSNPVSALAYKFGKTLDILRGSSAVKNSQPRKYISFTA